MAAPDAAERAGHVEDVKKYIDLAADLGCGLVRVLAASATGAASGLRSSITWWKALRRCCLRRLNAA